MGSFFNSFIYGQSSICILFHLWFMVRINTVVWRIHLPKDYQDYFLVVMMVCEQALPLIKLHTQYQVRLSFWHHLLGLFWKTTVRMVYYIQKMPKESRPGRIAIFASCYKSISTVTKVWKKTLLILIVFSINLLIHIPLDPWYFTNIKEWGLWSK